MIEILFEESEACSMKCAKGLAKQPQTRADGPTAVIGNPPQFGRKEAWAMIEGSSDEVVCLSYLMDLGDIRQPFDSGYRQQLILDLKYGRWKTGGQEQEMIRLDLLKYQQFSRLLELIEEGKPIRVWYSMAPYSYCGLCWLCYELKNRKADITVVKLPEYVVREDSVIVRYQSFCEVAGEEFYTFLNRQKKLTMQERRMYESKWIEMLDAGTMLRAVVNGRLLGVPEDFYDFLILQRMTAEPQKEAWVVGNILGHSQIAVGDWWYFYRIRRLAEEEKIRAVEDGENPGRFLISAK